MDLCLMMCVSLNAKVHGIITMLSPMKPRKFDTITCEPPTVVPGSCSVHQCTTIYADAILKETAHTHVYIYIHTHSNAS